MDELELRVMRAYTWDALIEARRETAEEIAAAVVDGAEPDRAQVERYRGLREEIRRRRDEHEQRGAEKPEAPPMVEGMPDSWQ